MNSQLRIIFIAIIYLFYNLIFADNLLITSIGLSFSLYIALIFLQTIGKQIPLKELIILIACSQWIVGAKIGYAIGKVHYKYYMYVEEEVYMTYVVPGVILFYFGLVMVKFSITKDGLTKYFEVNRESMSIISSRILIVGLTSFLVSSIIKIPQLAFVFYLSNLLIYVAAAHYMYLIPQRKTLIFISTIFLMFIISLQSGFFHDLIISAAFLIFFWFTKKTTYLSKLAIVSVGFMSLYIIQVVKSEYRAIIWKSQGNVSVVSAFLDVLENEFAPTNEASNTIEINSNSGSEEQNNINTRLNQGWIISKVLDNVPKNQEFLEGETIVEAIKSSFLPRFLFPNKKGAEQALINFRTISGIDLNKGTSMGLSVIGEFYGNYGIVGGWLAMFIYGLFLAVIIKYLAQGLGEGSPLILLWFILFFFQVIKAETDFIKILNHLVKSIVFFLFIKFIFKWLNINLLPNIDTE